SVVTDFQVVEQMHQTKVNVPVTFGQVFVRGDVPAGIYLQAVSADGVKYDTQVDEKARHADGSLRHGIITVFIPQTETDKTENILLTTTSVNPNSSPLTIADLLATSYDVVVNLNVGGQNYRASAKELLQNVATNGTAQKWLSGGLVTEWLLQTPVLDDNDQPHSHLTARFNVRAYKGMDRVRTSVIIENDWAYEPNPSGFTYDVSISVAGKIIYTKFGLAHTHHARWRKVFWWGEEPDIDVKHNIEYLFSTRSVPTYDRKISVSQAALANMNNNFEPMSNGNISEYMPQTGAQDGIGPLPRWAALYLLTMDPRAKGNILMNGDAAGSYQVHYRDKTTDLPVSLDDHPYMTLLGNYEGTYNPRTGRHDAFPSVSNSLQKYMPDDAHQPSLAYLPYVVTGDYYYLEELQFWANWNMLRANPEYRAFEKGLLRWGQVRAQAWSLRTLGQVAYITPDDHPLKHYFVERLNNNIETYLEETVQNPDVNKLGLLAEGNYIVAEPYMLPPWEDDFFTWTTGYLVHLGFANALPLLRWKSAFVLGRLIDPDYCWLHASEYDIQIGTKANGIFKTFAQLDNANFSSDCRGLEMSGYPESATGFGANLQPAIAMVADAGIEGGAEAWMKYETRSPKQDYSSSPQFAIVPRTLNPGYGLVPPVINPPGGKFSGSVQVTLSTPSSGASIYFTLDGSTPSQASTLYTHSFQLTNKTMVKAIAVSNGLVSSINSADFIIEQDLISPKIENAVAYLSPARVIVRFSEGIEKASAENIAHYAIDHQILISNASLSQDGKTVILITSDLIPDINYTLTVNGIKDLAASPNTIAANSKFMFSVKKRAQNDLIVLYTFTENKGTIIKDVSGVGVAMDIQIENPAAVKWGDGFLKINGATTIASSGAATKIVEACKASKEVTIEAWVRPASLNQSGPARIVTLSSDAYHRDFTLGQESSSYETRLRTTTTGENGMNPALRANAVVLPQLTHLVYTRSSQGSARIFINGKQVSNSSDISGSFANWSDFRFALANELNGGRKWLGEFHLVAVYSRALTENEILGNFAAGPFSADSPLTLQRGKTKQPESFNLRQNYPNPFNAETTIEFNLSNATFATVKIYSVTGKEIETLVSGNLTAGIHRVKWNAGDWASGVYFYRLIITRIEGEKKTLYNKKLLLMK
ncbi:MAG: T9SS type A sorting domain-containing protein, partial [Actinobacteria bacterium]|nr:T9SS type A sorting domain-containing protein [Actinomycetota bacterium]